MPDVFRCDYCGTYNPQAQATIFWCPTGELDNGDQIYTTGIYCSPYCGERAAAGDLSVGGR